TLEPEGRVGGRNAERGGRESAREDARGEAPRREGALGRVLRTPRAVLSLRRWQSATGDPGGPMAVMVAPPARVVTTWHGALGDVATSRRKIVHPEAAGPRPRDAGYRRRRWTSTG